MSFVLLVEEAMAELLENKKKLEQEITETQELIQKKRNDLAATENPIMKVRSNMANLYTCLNVLLTRHYIYRRDSRRQ